MEALLITQGLRDAIEHITKKEGKNASLSKRSTRKPQAPSS